MFICCYIENKTKQSEKYICVHVIRVLQDFINLIVYNRKNHKLD